MVEGLKGLAKGLFDLMVEMRNNKNLDQESYLGLTRYFYSFKKFYFDEEFTNNLSIFLQSYPSVFKNFWSAYNENPKKTLTEYLNYVKQKYFINLNGTITT